MWKNEAVVLKFTLLFDHSDSKSLPWISRFTASMIKIFQRDGGNRTVGSKPYRFQVLAQVVGSGCWLLPKPMYNVTDKQVDHSPSSVFFFNFLFALLMEQLLASQKDPWWVLMTLLRYAPPFHQSGPFILWAMLLLFNAWLGLSLPTKGKTWNLQFHAPSFLNYSLPKPFSKLTSTT